LRYLKPATTGKTGVHEIRDNSQDTDKVFINHDRLFENFGRDVVSHERQMIAEYFLCSLVLVFTKGWETSLWFPVAM